ncbi:MAG: hypothetical protein HC811_04930 [Flammeovirgaceae bacterium]|nr:hypothetical protein [Flammeovirgaceae bacterium]
MKGPSKILLLLLGIIVALVITLTTWVYMDKPEAVSPSPDTPSSMSKPTTAFQKIIGIVPFLVKLKN